MFSFLVRAIYFLTDNSQIKECNVQAVIYTPPGEEQLITTSKVRVQACLFLALIPSVVGNSFFILVLLIKSKHCYWLCSDEGLDWCCDVCQICNILFNIFILLSMRAKYLILKPQDFPNIWGMNKYSKCLQLLLLLQLPGLEKSKVRVYAHACVLRVRGRERNTVWALLGSGEISNKKHILQAAGELFLPCAFTSPQAVNFVVWIFLRLIIYSMQGLNLQILIWQSSISLQGVLCVVYPVEGRERWLTGTCWLWSVAEDPADFSKNWASVSSGRSYMNVGDVGDVR